jgi:ParB/RepB/Spo0J family partition protein
MTGPREIERIESGDILVGKRHRTPTDDAIDVMRRSIEEIGLQCPILVRSAENIEIDGKMWANHWVLVAGATRLAAVKALGWPTIDAIDVGEVSDIEAEKIEIAENLHRTALTKAERDAHLKRFIELVRQQDADDAEKKTGGTAVPPVLSDGRRSGPQHEEGLATRVAREAGVSKQHVNRVLNPKPKPAAPSDDFDSPEKRYQRWVESMDHMWRIAEPEWRERWLLING